MTWLQVLRNRYRVTADPLRTQRAVELLALFLGLLLCLQLAYNGVRLATRGAPEAVEPVADSLAILRVRPPATVADGERQEIIGRPLFWASRRPLAGVDDAQENTIGRADAGELRGVTQVGVFGSGEDAGIIALVKGKKRRILLGETLDGWTLESIRDTRSEFANGERRETLTLMRGNVAVSSGDSVETAPTSAPSRRRAPAAESSEAAQVRQESGSSGVDEAPAPAEQAPAESGLGLGLGGRASQK